MNNYYKQEDLSFSEAESSRLDDGYLSPSCRNYSYIERGLYTRQIARALSLFKRDQILVLKSDDLLHKYERTLERIAYS